MLETWGGELFLTPDVYHCSVLSNLHISSHKWSLFVPSSFRGIFLTEAWFSPEGRWFSRNSGCQDLTVPPQNTGVGVRCVSLLSSLNFSWTFLVVGTSVFATTIYRCGARPSHHCNLPDHIPSSLRSSCSFLRFILADPLSVSHSRRPSLCITTFSSHERRRGESEWISLRLMDSPTFLSTSFSACFGDLHVSTSVYHDVYTGDNLPGIMQHFQARTSTYGFHLSGILLGTTFFI
jgi:hypothetical protein